MGSMVTAACHCGYSSDVLSEGCGFDGPRSCWSLARCGHCKEIVSVRSRGARPICPKCRRSVVLMRSPELGAGALTGDLPATGVECPRCGAHSMTLDEVGLWD
jgi:hypothetical protein